MTVILGIIIGIVIFMILVLIHEWGHFFAARRSGVKVLEFGIGIPPRAKTITTDKKGTKYTLNRLPLGGFMRPKGEDPKNPDDFHAKDSLISAPLYKKAIIMLAGITMNFVLARVLLTILLAVGIKPFSVIPEGFTNFELDSVLLATPTQLQQRGFDQGLSQAPAHDVIINHISSGSVLHDHNIRTGAIITMLGNKTVTTKNFFGTLQDRTTGSLTTTIQTIDNDAKTIDIPCEKSPCRLGIGISQTGLQKTFEAMANNTTIQYPLVQAMGKSAHEIYRQTSMTFTIMGNLAKNLLTFNQGKLKEQVSSFSGPVGIVKIVTDVVHQGDISKLLVFMAMISIALGAFNLLPIPALDGGRLLTAIIQSVFRLPKEKYFVIEGYINMFFFAILLLLGVFIIFKDLSTFWGVSFL